MKFLKFLAALIGLSIPAGLIWIIVISYLHRILSHPNLPPGGPYAIWIVIAIVLLIQLSLILEGASQISGVKIRIRNKHS